MKRLLASVVAAVGLYSLPAQAQQYVCMDSSLGTFCMQLLHDDAPRTVNNFLNYVRDGDYNNGIVHRSERRMSGENFVIQGGGYRLTGEGFVASVPPDGPVSNEYKEPNRRGTVAMATIAGRPNSATSQWFINLSDNTNLDYQNGGFTVFAKVVKGLEVVDAIANLNRVNLSTALGAAFTEVPVTTNPGMAWAQTRDLVLIHKVYALDHLPSPFHCTYDSPQDAVTELCGNFFTLPVRIGNEYYSAKLVRDDSVAGITASVERGSLHRISEVPASVAEYDAASRTLRIPSIRIGAAVFRDVTWQLQDGQTQRFLLTSFQ
jgi:cyclophilin family peptidyl-prolyl cis-trans isomerase